MGEQLTMSGKADNPFTNGKQQPTQLADHIGACEGVANLLGI